MTPLRRNRAGISDDSLILKSDLVSETAGNRYPPKPLVS
jgi:hypothetical protein